MTSISLLLAAVAVAAPPPPKPAGEERILVGVRTKLTELKPDGTEVKAVPIPESIPSDSVVRLTPDRKYALAINRSLDDKTHFRSRLEMVPLTDADKPFRLDGYTIGRFVSGGDGPKYYVTAQKAEEQEKGAGTIARLFEFDSDSRKVKELPVPDMHAPWAVSPDGTYLVSNSPIGGGMNKTFLTKFGEKESHELFGGKPAPPTNPVFSADGSKILAVDASTRAVAVISTATRKETTLPLDASYLAGTWSPDGKRIAILNFNPTMFQQAAGGAPGAREVEIKLTVADADGGNAKVVYTTKGSLPLQAYVQWR